MTINPDTDKQTRFWNRIARKYAADPVADPASYQHKLDLTAGYLKPEMTVLEFGCGTGTTALIHAPRVARIDAIDFSSEMIAIAREKAGDVDNVFLETAAIEDWPAPEGGYDAIMAHSVLHLVDDLDATLARVRTMLKPGGIFVSSTACIRDMGLILSLVLPVGGTLGVIPRVTCLRGEALRRRIQAAGFEPLEFWRPGPRKAVFMIARAV